MLNTVGHITVETFDYYRFDGKTGQRQFYRTMRSVPSHGFMTRYNSDNKYFTKGGKPRKSIREGGKTFYLVEKP